MLPHDLTRADTGLAFVVSFLLYTFFDQYDGDSIDELHHLFGRSFKESHSISRIYRSLRFSMFFVVSFLVAKHLIID